MPASSWSHEDTELLKRLWAEGFSASQIGKRLAGAFTRNAVIGKAYRLKLASRVASKRSPYTGRRTTSNRHRLRKDPGNLFAMYGEAASVAGRAWKLDTALFGDARPKFKRGPNQIGAEPLDAPAPEIPVPPEQRKALIDLEEGDCRFPYGDGPYTFCARPRLIGAPYCADHQRVASVSLSALRPYLGTFDAPMDMTKAVDELQSA